MAEEIRAEFPDDDPRVELATELRQLQIRSGKSLRELAESIHISDSALSRYLTGRVVPHWQVVEALGRIGEGDLDALRRLWRRARSARVDHRLRRAAPATPATPAGQQRPAPAQPPAVAPAPPQPPAVAPAPPPVSAPAPAAASAPAPLRRWRWATVAVLVMGIGLIAVPVTLSYRGPTSAGGHLGPAVSDPAESASRSPASPTAQPAASSTPGGASGGDPSGPGAGLSTPAYQPPRARYPESSAPARPPTTAPVPSSAAPVLDPRRPLRSGTGECLAADYRNVYTIPCSDVPAKAQTWRRVATSGDWYLLEGGTGQCLAGGDLEQVRMLDCATADPGLLWTWDDSARLWNVQTGHSLVADFAHQVYLYPGDGAGQTWTLEQDPTGAA